MNQIQPVFNCILQQCTWDGTTHKELEERVAKPVEKVEVKVVQVPVFKPIDFAEKDGSRYLAIGDMDAAIIEYQPRIGWVTYHLPGLGQTIGETLAAYHSICRLDELHPALNRMLHPEYYMKPGDVPKNISKAHQLYRRRTGQDV